MLIRLIALTAGTVIAVVLAFGATGHSGTETPTPSTVQLPAGCQLIDPAHLPPNIVWAAPETSICPNTSRWSGDNTLPIP